MDNLQIGFDFDYILNDFRLYGGLLIDEWAPYDTFSGDKNNDGIDDICEDEFEAGFFEGQQQEILTKMELLML